MLLNLSVAVFANAPAAPASEHKAPRQDRPIEAAELRNACRRNGIQVGTIDVLLARLCVRHDLVMLSADQDFTLMAPHVGLTNWEP